MSQKDTKNMSLNEVDFSQDFTNLFETAFSV